MIIYLIQTIKYNYISKQHYHNILKEDTGQKEDYKEN